MAEPHDPPQNKEELIARIDVAWDDLAGALADYSDEQLTTPRDASGWSAKDHLAHLAAWEASVVGLVRDRRPQPAGLGLVDDQAVFQMREDDEINALLQAAARDRPLPDVRAELADVHGQLVALLAAIPEADLSKPVGAYVEGGSDSPIYALINGNSWDHFDEHRGWIVTLMDGSGGQKESGMA